MLLLRGRGRGRGMREGRSRVGGIRGFAFCIVVAVFLLLERYTWLLSTLGLYPSILI